MRDDGTQGGDRFVCERRVRHMIYVVGDVIEVVSVGALGPKIKHVEGRDGHVHNSDQWTIAWHLWNERLEDGSFVRCGGDAGQPEVARDDPDHASEGDRLSKFFSTPASEWEAKRWVDDE